MTIVRDECELTLSIPDTIGAPGQMVMIPINIDCVENYDIVSIEFNVIFDQSVLHDIDVITEPALPDGWYFDYDTTQAE